MSLHRVSSLESWDNARNNTRSDARHRKMSFNPVPDLIPASSEESELITPKEVSRTIRIGKFGVFVLGECSLFHQYRL